MRYLRFLGFCGFLVGSLAFGQRTVARSANGSFAVIQDETRLGLKSVRKGEILWTAPFPQDAPPRNVRVTNDGRRVILQDYLRSGRHGELGGNGRSLVVLGEGGRTVAAYRLGDLLTESELISCGYYEAHGLILTPNRVWIDGGRLMIYCTTWDLLGGKLGMGLCFDLESGKELPLTLVQLKAMRDRSAELNRGALARAKGDEMYTAILEAQYLEDRRSLPILLRLISRNVDALLAMDAVCAIDPAQGRLLVQQHFDNPDAQASEEWIRRATAAGFRLDQSVLQRIVATGSYQRVRDVLIHLQALDKPAAASLARTLVNSSDKDIRAECVRTLRYCGSLADAALFRSLLKDNEVGTDAFFGLYSVRPPDLLEVLRAIASDEGSEHQWLATTELAGMGEPAALAKVVEAVRRLGEKGESGGMTLSECCEILADQKPQGAREALESALEAKDTWFNSAIAVRGALAALGDLRYLPYLRRRAMNLTPDASGRSRGDDWGQAEAIEWLVRVGDRGSLPDLERLSVQSRPAIARTYATVAIPAIRGGWNVTRFREALANNP